MYSLYCVAQVELKVRDVLQRASADKYGGSRALRGTSDADEVDPAVAFAAALLVRMHCLPARSAA